VKILAMPDLGDPIKVEPMPAPGGPGPGMGLGEPESPAWMGINNLGWMILVLGLVVAFRRRLLRIWRTIVM
jgi:hypothetical protein